MKDRPDPSFGLNNQAMALLHFLAAMEPDFAEYEHGRYSIEVSTYPWYNGREKGVCLVVQHGLCDPKALHITFGEIRNCDSIFVDHWVSTTPYNGPTLENTDPTAYEKAYQGRKVIGHGEIGKAAECIYGLMEDYYKTQKKEKAKESGKKD